MTTFILQSTSEFYRESSSDSYIFYFLSRTELIKLFLDIKLSLSSLS